MTEESRGRKEKKKEYCAPSQTRVIEMSNIRIQCHNRYSTQPGLKNCNAYIDGCFQGLASNSTHSSFNYLFQFPDLGFAMTMNSCH